MERYRRRTVFGWVVVVAGVGLMVTSAWRPGSRNGTLASAGAPVAVTGAGQPEVRCSSPPGAAPAGCGSVLPSADRAPGSWTVRFAGSGTRTVVFPAPSGGTGEDVRTFFVVGVRSFLLSALAILMVLVAFPYALNIHDPANERIGPWAFMLSEKGGGLSLAHVQLMLWFIPAAVLYFAQCLVLQAFAPIDSTITLLLGLSGATALLGAAASPTNASKEPTVPRPADLVQDWKGSGDLSRYQCLLVSAFGAATMVVAFFRDMTFPDIPDQFLYLVAASQGTYLGTKAVKAIQVPGQGESPAQDQGEPAPAAPPADAKQE